MKIMLSGSRAPVCAFPGVVSVRTAPPRCSAENSAVAQRCASDRTTLRECALFLGYSSAPTSNSSSSGGARGVSSSDGASSQLRLINGLRGHSLAVIGDSMSRQVHTFGSRTGPPSSPMFSPLLCSLLSFPLFRSALLCSLTSHSRRVRPSPPSSLVCAAWTGWSTSTSTPTSATPCTRPSTPSPPRPRRRTVPTARTVMVACPPSSPSNRQAISRRIP